MAKFQELMLCPRGARDEAALCEAEDGEGLVLLHDRLVTACAEVESHHDLVQNRKTFCALEEIRRLACEAAKCRYPVRKKMPTQNCPEGSARIRGRKSSVFLREGDGHEALGQWPCQ